MAHKEYPPIIMRFKTINKFGELELNIALLEENKSTTKEATDGCARCIFRGNNYTAMHKPWFKKMYALTSFPLQLYTREEGKRYIEAYAECGITQAMMIFPQGPIYDANATLYED